MDDEEIKHNLEQWIETQHKAGNKLNKLSATEGGLGRYYFAIFAGDWNNDKELYEPIVTTIHNFEARLKSEREQTAKEIFDALEKIRKPDTVVNTAWWFKEKDYQALKAKYLKPEKEGSFTATFDEKTGKFK